MGVIHVRINFTTLETRVIVLPGILKTARSYLHSSGPKTGTWRDRRTDGQICFSSYNICLTFRLFCRKLGTQL